jgi:hypothetical protein
MEIMLIVLLSNLMLEGLRASCSLRLSCMRRLSVTVFVQVTDAAVAPVLRFSHCSHVTGSLLSSSVLGGTCVWDNGGVLCFCYDLLIK